MRLARRDVHPSRTHHILWSARDGPAEDAPLQREGARDRRGLADVADTRPCRDPPLGLRGSQFFLPIMCLWQGRHMLGYNHALNTTCCGIFNKPKSLFDFGASLSPSHAGGACQASPVYGTIPSTDGRAVWERGLGRKLLFRIGTPGGVRTTCADAAYRQAINEDSTPFQQHVVVIDTTQHKI